MTAIKKTKTSEDVFLDSLSPELFTKKITSVPVRDGFGEGLLMAGESDPRVVALTADLKDSTRVTAFANKFPARFIECGVSEQAMITVASGLASYGKVPVTCSFSAFSPGRTWEQIRTTICLNDVHVVIAGHFGGVSVGPDGATHQMLEDIALMRSLPNMIVVAPSDAIEARKAIMAAVSVKKPIYLRIPRETSPVYTTPETPFEIGKAIVLREDNDPQVAILAHGLLVYEAMLASRILSKKGISSIVLNVHTIKPLDEQAITKAARLAGCVVVCEDHQVAGGLGGAVSELLSTMYPVPMSFIGVKDMFGQTGSPQELLDEYKLRAEDIAKASLDVISRKARFN